MIKILFTFVVAFVFAEPNDVFFKNLERFSDSKKQELLERRLDAESYGLSFVDTERTIRTYIKVRGINRESVSYLKSLLKKASNEQFKAQTAKSIFEACNESKDFCFNNFALFSQGYDKEDIVHVEYLILDMLKLDNFDLIIQNIEKIEAALNLRFSKKEAYEMAFKRMVRLGLLKPAGRILKLKQLETVKDEGLLFSVCRYYYLMSQEKLAKDCLSKKDKDTFRIFLIYVTYLESKKEINLKSESGKILLKNLESLKLAPDSIVIYAIANKKLIPGVSASHIQKISEDYFLGFATLSLDKKYKFLSEEMKTQLLQSYSKEFANTLLFSILSNKRDSSVLVKGLRENHILRQALF